MSLYYYLAWIIIGVITGWLYCLLAGQESAHNLIVDACVGIFCAIVGGALFVILGGPADPPVEVWSLFTAFIAAVTGLGLMTLFSGPHRE